MNMIFALVSSRSKISENIIWTCFGQRLIPFQMHIVCIYSHRICVPSLNKLNHYRSAIFGNEVLLGNTAKNSVRDNRADVKETGMCLHGLLIFNCRRRPCLKRVCMKIELVGV